MPDAMTRRTFLGDLSAAGALRPADAPRGRRAARRFPSACRGRRQAMEGLCPRQPVSLRQAATAEDPPESRLPESPTEGPGGVEGGGAGPGRRPALLPARSLRPWPAGPRARGPRRLRAGAPRLPERSRRDRARLRPDPESGPRAGARRGGPARPRRVLLLGEGEAGSDGERAPDAGRLSGGVLRRPELSRHPGPPRLRGDRDRHVLPRRAAPGAG